jgi:hypothetical protein
VSWGEGAFAMNSHAELSVKLTPRDFFKVVGNRCKYCDVGIVLVVNGSLYFLLVW